MLQIVEKFTEDIGWSICPIQLPEPLAFTGVATNNGIIYILGGEHKGDDSRSVFKWDTFGEFEKLQDLSDDQSCDSSSLIVNSQDVLYIFGAGEGDSPSIFSYALE